MTLDIVVKAIERRAMKNAKSGKISQKYGLGCYMTLEPIPDHVFIECGSDRGVNGNFCNAKKEEKRRALYIVALIFKRQSGILQEGGFFYNCGYCTVLLLNEGSRTAPIKW